MADADSGGGHTPATDGHTAPAMYDHLRPAGGSADARASAGGADSPVDPPVDPGIYRVVGTPPGSVTLLRVGDADGRRVNSGEVVTVDRDALAAFDPADNPDGNRPLGETVAGAVETVGWNVRVFAGALAARPLATLVALALLAASQWGERYVSAPDSVFSVAFVLGFLVLVAVGVRGG